MIISNISPAYPPYSPNRPNEYSKSPGLLILSYPVIPLKMSNPPLTASQEAHARIMMAPGPTTVLAPIVHIAKTAPVTLTVPQPIKLYLDSNPIGSMKVSGLLFP